MPPRWCAALKKLPIFCAPILVLAGCGGAHSHVITLHFWNGFTGPDGTTMLRMVRRFNSQNPGIQVLMQRIEWNTYYSKLYVAGAGRRAPEIFVSHTRALERFASAGFVRQNDDLINGPAGLPVSDIDANVWKASEWRGHHYGLPLDCHVMGMFYNRGLFKQAGIVDAHGSPVLPANRAQFLADMAKLTHPASGSQAAQWGYVFTNYETVTYNFMMQFGGAFFTPDYRRCIINNPQNAAALQFCSDLIRKYHYAPPPEDFDSWIGFRQGKVATAYEGIYMLADLQQQTDADFGGGPVPQIGDHKAVWADSHNLCLRSDLKGAELQAAWRFISFLSQNSLDWAAGGQVPVRKSLRNTARFRAMHVQYAFSTQIPFAKYLPQLPFIFEFLTEYDAAVEKALRGTLTPEQALALVQSNVNAIISRALADGGQF